MLSQQDLSVYTQPFLEHNEHVQRLVEVISSEFGISEVPLKPAPGAKKFTWYDNVMHMVSKEGGRLQYGWLVYQSRIIIEAQHHAVWVTPNEEMIDVTPTDKYVNAAFFIPDNRYPITDKPVDFIRLNKTNNPAVDDIINIDATLEQIKANRGNLKKDIIIERYQDVLKKVLSFIYQGGTPETECYCNSEVPYKDCHSKWISELLEKDRKRFPSDIIIFGKHANT